jgi:hypothetical protein
VLSGAQSFAVRLGLASVTLMSTCAPAARSAGLTGTNRTPSLVCQPRSSMSTVWTTAAKSAAATGRPSSMSIP